MGPILRKIINILAETEPEVFIFLEKEYGKNWRGMLNKELNQIGQNVLPDDHQAIEGIGEGIEDNLYNAGIETIDQLCRTTDDELLQISGIGKAKIKKINSWKQKTGNCE